MGSYPKIKKFQKLSHVNDTFGPSLNLLLLYFMCRAMSNKHLLLHEGVILCAHWEDLHLLDQKVKVTSIYDITLHNFITMFHNVCFILFKISVIFFFKLSQTYLSCRRKCTPPLPSGNSRHKSCLTIPSIISARQITWCTLPCFLSTLTSPVLSYKNTLLQELIVSTVL